MHGPGPSGVEVAMPALGRREDLQVCFNSEVKAGITGSRHGLQQYQNIQDIFRDYHRPERHSGEAMVSRDTNSWQEGNCHVYPLLS